MVIGKKQVDAQIFEMVIELKSEILINAGIRAAERNFTNAYVTKRGDNEAGAIFVKINTLDGYAKLFARNLKYDLINENDVVEFVNLYPEKKIQNVDIDKRISKEIEIDSDCWIVEIEDKEGRNPFQSLNC